MFDCPLYILTIVPQSLEELDAEKMDYISRWQELAKELNVEEYIIKEKENRPVTKVIAEVARQSISHKLFLDKLLKAAGKKSLKGR